MNESINQSINQSMTTSTDWAQVNTTKSEGSSAIYGPRTWKWGSIGPLCTWLRGPWPFISETV